MGKNKIVPSGKSIKLIFFGNKGQSRFFRNSSRYFFTEIFRAVQTCSYRSPSDSKPKKVFFRIMKHITALFQHHFPCGDFLPESKRDSILQMGTSDFDKMHVLFTFFLKKLNKMIQWSVQFVMKCLHSSDVHSCRERIIR